MSDFYFEKSALNGVYIITIFFIDDNRGGFTKNFEKDIYANAGIHFSVNETFTSVSSKNVIRGLHFQIHHPQAKLISVIKGKVWDVIVDLHLNSPTYKHWVSIELSADNHKSLYIPKGFAHGFVSLEDDTIMLYQCDGTYDQETDTGIVFNDPAVGIKWPIAEKEAILSTRDLGLMSLQEYEERPMEIEIESIHTMEDIMYDK